jgi:DNA-binding MurR/RpiR family transcriptional regulator
VYSNLIPQIRAALDSLRPAERKVAEVVLADAVDDDIKTMIDKVSDSASEGIALMRQTLDPAAMEAAISALVSARTLSPTAICSDSMPASWNRAMSPSRYPTAVAASKSTKAYRLPRSVAQLQ